MIEVIRMMRKFTMALSVFLLFAGVASAQQPESGGAKKIDTCALLTKAEIQEAIGKNVQDGKLNPNANPAVGAPCEFVVEPYGAFSLLVKPVGPGETADRMMAELTKAKITVSEAPGIGDRSFYASPGYGMTQLNTFKGPTYIIITLLVPDATEIAQKAAAEKLMRKVLPRL
jgi:hypothetical protein